MAAPIHRPCGRRVSRARTLTRPRGAAAATGTRERPPQTRAGHLKKSHCGAHAQTAVIFRYIEEQRGTWPIVRLCHALGVSTSGYYTWRQRGPSPRAQANVTLLVQLRAIHQETRATYGSRRMQAELVARGQPCSVNRVARLMRLAHRVKTTRVDPARPVAPNRVAQHFVAGAPNRLWLGDTLAPRLRVAQVQVSRTFRPNKAGCIWPRSWMCIPAGLSAGHWMPR